MEFSQEIRNNAIITYLLPIFNFTFFFNKKDKNIHNTLVLHHTKNAIIIHGLYLIVYIFSTLNILNSIAWQGFTLHFIITTGLFIFIMILQIIGMYNAYNSTSSESVISQSKKIGLSIDTKSTKNLAERLKVDLFISYIPFLSFLFYNKYKENSEYRSNVNISMIVTLILLLLISFGHTTMSFYLLLLYCVYIIFNGVNIFIFDQVLSPKIPGLLTVEQYYLRYLTLKEYIKKYIKGNDELVSFNNQLAITAENYTENEKKNHELLSKKPDFPLPFSLMYIPVINLLLAISPARSSKYRFHLQNGLGITIIFIISVALEILDIYSTGMIALFLLVPIFFGIGYKDRLAYKMPLFWHIGKLFMWKDVQASKKTKKSNPNTNNNQTKSNLEIQKTQSQQTKPENQNQTNNTDRPIK